MEPRTVTLPSRAQVELRPLRIAEENKLARGGSQDAKTQGKALEEVLQACVVSCADPGPYSDISRSTWPSVLAGDKFALMLELRKISYREGNQFVVLDLMCPSQRCPSFDYAIDLDKDLLVREITDDAFDRVQSGKPFEAIVAKHKVLFVPATGITEELVHKFERQHPGRNMATILRARILDVYPLDEAGQPAAEPINRRDILDWLDGNGGASRTYPGLTSQDGEDLRDAFDAIECGVETDVKMECEHCGRAFTFQLPFGGGFLVPSTGIRKRHRDLRRGKES